MQTAKSTKKPNSKSKPFKSKILVEEKVDIAIIGAGIVGLAIAAEVSDGKRSIVVFERHPSFGQETSSRNSGVIHAGIYYPDDSLKAKLCVEGNRLIYEICESGNIPHRRLGKLIVASSADEIRILEQLYALGRARGIPLHLLDSRGIKRFEENISARAALYSPSTGIVEPYYLMKYLSTLAEVKGAVLRYDSEVVSIEYPGSFVIRLQNDCVFESKILINCAGLEAHKIAQMLGVEYKIYYCKGDYWKTNKRIVSHLVYPIPTKISLGIHITPALDGGLRLGPNAYYVDKVYYDVDISRKEEFHSVKKFIPSLDLENDIWPDTSGIRPKLQGPNDDFRDFVIKHEEKVPGLINCIGIDSPGLTAAPAIAKYVSKIVDEILS